MTRDWMTPSRLDMLVLEANWGVLRRQLARGMAHDVRGPLHSLLLVQQNVDPRANAPDLELFLATVRDASGRLREMADWLADMTRASHTGSIGPVAIADLIPRVVRLSALYREAARSGVTVELGEKLPAVRGSPRSLEHALLNLVLNARDALASRGEDAAAGVITITAARTGEAVEISVADSGPGVPDADRERIFEPFYTTRGRRRLGLGLPAASFLLGLSGGTVALDAGPPGGRFVVRLPVWG